MRPLRAALRLSILVVLGSTCALGSSGPPPVEVDTPPVALAGIRATVTLTASCGVPDTGIPVRVVHGDELLGAAVLAPCGEETIRFVPRGTGLRTLEIRSDEYAEAVPVAIRVVPGWWSLAPPFLAIVLALIFRQVVPALLAGVWLGASIVYGGPLVGLLRMLDHYLVGALTDSDRIAIVMFSLMLGGMVGVISRSGGMAGLVDTFAARATTPARAQIATWVLGVAVFFDDYANTLVVGNTMRPVTDRLRISREKLAYIVDSTAAPVAAIAVISTWIGYEISLIDGALQQIGSDHDAYFTFLRAIPYNFYPILALVFGFTIAVTRRDFGPMLVAERRAASGQVLRDGAEPLADFDSEALRPVPDRPRRWPNAVVPVLTVVTLTFVGQWFTGLASLAADGDPLGSASVLSMGFRDIGTVFTSGNSFHALMYAAAAGCLVAIAMARFQGILRLPQAMHAWNQGMKAMLLAFVILTLAWSISDVCVDLQASGYVASALSGAIDPRLLPALVFVFAALIAFSTGTSWATMGILIPLAVPASFEVAQSAGFDAVATDHVFMASIAAVLSGAIFGDHCSPISDTTVLSSMSSGSDHIDHVRTQLPYAMTVGAAAILLGYLPEALGVPPLVALAIGSVALVAVVRFVARPVSPS